MNVRTVALVFIAAVAACGGKTIGEPDTTTTTGTTTTAPTSTSPQSSTGNVPPTPTPTPPPTQDDSRCSNNGSSASGDANSCMSDTSWVCGNGARYPEIQCRCDYSDGGAGSGSCSCDDLTFAFDCAQGCSPGAAELARCNIRP